MIRCIPLSRSWLRGNHALLKEAYAVVGDGSSEQYSPDEDLYRDAELDPRNFILLVEDADTGDTAGCAIVVFNRSSHSDITYATNDLIYIRPSYAGRFLEGGELVARAEREAADRGADEFRWYIPVGSPLDKAFSKPHRRSTYRPFEVSYRKLL